MNQKTTDNAAKPPFTGAELQKMLDGSPFIHFLGLKVIEADPAKEQVTMSCAFKPEFDLAQPKHFTGFQHPFADFFTVDERAVSRIEILHHDFTAP